MRIACLLSIVTMLASCGGVDPVASAANCTACWTAGCTSQIAACNANAQCKAIADCVTVRSPCTNWSPTQPYCDDDCVKVTCTNLHPGGAALYKALGSCDNMNECSPKCGELCAPGDKLQKCNTADTCDLEHPTPDACKCNFIDGGTGPGDGGVSSDGGDGGSDAGSASCTTTPTCPTADEVNSALGTSVGDPTVAGNVSGGISVIECTYQAPPGPNFTEVIVRLQFPDDQSGFDIGRGGFSGTSDVTDLGNPPVPAYATSEFGQTVLVALIGCVEIEVTSQAALSSEEALVEPFISTWRAP